MWGKVMMVSIRRLLLAGSILFGLVLVCSPSSALADPPCTGTIQVTDTDNDTVLGFVSDQWNSDGEYVVTNTAADYLTVSFTPGSQFEITATNGPNATYPLVGGIEGFASSSPDIGSGSANYLYLGGTTTTAPGATPQSGLPNSFTTATGAAEDIESAIWSNGANDQLIPQWINTDGSAPATYLVDSAGLLVMTGDVTAFENGFGPASDVALNLVPTSSGCGDLALAGMPSDITTNATSASGATVTYTPPTPTLSGNPDSAATVICDPASGSTFPIGTTMVNCSATDADAANSPAASSFTVTVNNNTLELGAEPANITTNATSPSGAVVTYTAPPATDEAGQSPAPTVGCVPASGSTFPIGTTTVKCTATDANDFNSPTSQTFTVTVDDNALEISQVPGNIGTAATSPSGAVVTYTAPTATDEAGESPAPTVGCVPASGSTFPIGTTTVKCTATDSNDFNSPISATFTITVGAPPVPVASPQATGTAEAGHTLSCSTGGWSYFPTAYAYQWSLNGTPIVGATGSTYPVQKIDEGSTLTCTVTASNAEGHGTSTSSGVRVAVPVVPRCPKASGRLSGATLGLIHLGMTREQAQHVYRHSSNHGDRQQDFFCLTPIGIRVGYPSTKVLSTLTAAARAQLRSRVVWASTSNPYFALEGIRPGARIATVLKRLAFGAPIPIGVNHWYLAPFGPATAVLKVRHGVVQEVGIAERRLTKTRAAQTILMGSFD
jgi:hypothetical protein